MHGEYLELVRSRNGGDGPVRIEAEYLHDRGAQARIALTARLLLEYDGSGFAGWARQPGLRTVQGVLEEALETVARRPRTLTVAGRTDSGVHARGQVASHAGEPVDAARAERAAAGRRERACAPSRRRRASTPGATPGRRTYRYRVLAAGGAEPARARAGAARGRGRSTATPLGQCAAALAGTHDFTAFTPTQTDHVRFERDVMRAEWVEERDGVLAFWIEADTFMRHMVRILVGTMLAVAGGRETAPGFARLLTGRPRAEAADTAPRTASTSRACATDEEPLRLSSKAVKVLLTNDDGIEAIGLRMMREALLEVPDMELAVIAPDSNRSATARSITTRQPLWVEEVDFGDGGSGFATDGTPVDCVRFAALGLVEFEPELIVSGINHGANLGDDITYSGTVAAALEGVVLGIPAIAASQQAFHGRLDSWVPHDWQRSDFEQAAAFVARMVEEVARGADARGHAPERQLPGRRGAGRARLQARQARLPRPDEARRGGGRRGAATGSTASSPATARRTAPTSRRSATAASRSRRCTST